MRSCIRIETSHDTIVHPRCKEFWNVNWWAPDPTWIAASLQDAQNAINVNLISTSLTEIRHSEWNVLKKTVLYTSASHQKTRKHQTPKTVFISITVTIIWGAQKIHSNINNDKDLGIGTGSVLMTENWYKDFDMQNKMVQFLNTIDPLIIQDHSEILWYELLTACGGAFISSLSCSFHAWCLLLSVRGELSFVMFSTT
jgi:hypothetical protein